MFPTIHSFEANDLQTQGYGALSDCLSCEVTEELNGGFTLEMKYPLNGAHAEYLIPSNIIMAKPNHNQTQQPFRISQVRKSFSNAIVVYANHISYDLSGYPYRWARTYSSLDAVINALNTASWSTGNSVYHKFTFRTDMSSNKSFKMDGIQTMRSWMGGQEGSILDVYGGEWEYDTFECYLKSRRGEDTGIRISYGKNLAEYEKDRTNAEYSHVCAYWKKSDVLVCSDLISTGVNCTFRSAYVDASSNYDTQPTVAQLNTYAQAHVPKMDIDAQTITVTPVQIGNDIIGLGDSVLICYESVFETRVIKTVWDALAGRYKTLELGSKKANITDTIKSLTTAPNRESGYVDPSADYVLEEGTSNSWYYRKWNSGRYECWLRSAEKTVSCTTAWNGWYYGSIATQNFPITFVDYPVLEVTVQVAGGAAVISPDYPSRSATGPVYLYRPSSSSSVKAYANYYAEGRWQ